jgi:hypothetical protein
MAHWDVFHGKEGESNWLRRDETLQYLMAELENGKGTALLALLKTNFYDLSQVLYSARTQLTLTACKFMAILARCLSSEDFEPFVDISISSLLRVCAGTKKLVAGAGQEALERVFEVAPASKILAAVTQTMQDKNSSLRQRVLEALLTTVRQREERWFPRYWSECEPLLIRVFGDASPAVRSAAIELLSIAERHCSPDAIPSMMNKLDFSTAKQLKQLLAKNLKPLIPQDRNPFIIISPPQQPVKQRESHESLSQVDEDETDDEVIIPMQRISINDTGNDLSKSRIPKRSPNASKIVLCTPFRSYIRHHNPTTSPSLNPQISVDFLVSQLSVEGSVPIATWRKLSLIAEGRHSHLTPERVYLILEAIHHSFSKIPAEDLGSIGMLVKNIMALSNDYLSFTTLILDILVFLDKRLSEFSLLWKNSPFEWITITKERLSALINYAQEVTAPCTVHVLEALQQIFVSNNVSNDSLAESLPTLDIIWRQASDVGTKKAVVACIATVRRQLGDSAFFQFLPLLAIPQRRLLDAYMSMGTH